MTKTCSLCTLPATHEILPPLDEDSGAYLGCDEHTNELAIGGSTVTPLVGDNPP